MFPTCILGPVQTETMFWFSEQGEFPGSDERIACGAMSFLTGSVGQQVTSEPLIRQLSQNQSLWAALL